MIGLDMEVDNTYALVLLGALAYPARSVPIFLFARARGLPHAWLALFAALDIFVLMACVGVRRRVILWFAGITVALSVGVLVIIVLIALGGGETSGGLDRSVLFGPDVIAMFLWMAACKDAGISRGWGFLAAWPVIGGVGAWRIVAEVRGRIQHSPAVVAGAG